MDRLDHRRPYWRTEDEEPDTAEFQETHRSLSDRVERLLMQLVILGLVALVLVQTLQVIPFIRRQINLTEAMEGVSYNEMLSWSDYGSSTTPEGDGSTAAVASTNVAVSRLSLTVVLVSHRSAPEARLLVDGKAAGDFSSGTVTAAVKPGQEIRVDGSRSAQPLTFRVVGAPGVAAPALGASVTTQRNQQSLGRVQAIR